MHLFPAMCIPMMVWFRCSAAPITLQSCMSRQSLLMSRCVKAGWSPSALQNNNGPSALTQRMKAEARALCKQLQHGA